MSTPRLFVSSSAASRRERALELVGKLPRGDARLLLSSEQESADHFARELAARHGSLFALRRLTLDALAYELALPALARAGRASHSRLGREAVMARVVHRGLHEKRLGELQQVADGPGLVRALTATIHQCRLHGVTPAALAGIGPEGDVLSYIASAYETLSEEHGVADRAHVLKCALDALDAFEGRYVGVPIVLLDQAVTSPAEFDLVAAIAARAPESVATIPSGDDVSRGYLEEALGCDAETLPSGNGSALSDLKKYVFSGDAPPKRDALHDVVILSAPGEAQEAVEIVRAVRDTAASGTPFDEIAVLLRAPETYTPLLEDAFSRAEIPAFFEKGTTRPDPAGRAFLALMDCAAEELSATRFAEYLSLAQVPKLDAEGQPVQRESLDEEPDILWVPPQHALAPRRADAPEPVQLDLFSPPDKVEALDTTVAIEGGIRAPWRWEKLLVDAAVVGSQARWERRLAGLAREMEIRFHEIEDQESAEAESLKKDRDDLDHLKRYALPLIEALAALPSQALWGEWLEALERLAARALGYPEGVLAILKELRPMASVGPVEWMEVRAVLSERLTLLSQKPKDYRFGKVWIAPIDAARGMSFRVVLVPGLAERMFPRKIVEDPLLLDAQRRKLGAGLPMSEERASKERLALKLAIGAAFERIVFSYPSVDLQKGRGKVPSFYLLEIARASRGTLPDFESLERDAASSSGARLGWPAPRDHERAIDATEFDLAFLADALRRDASEDDVRGTGRYLVDVNPSLARSLRAKYQRGRKGKFTAVDGYLEPSEAARDTLREHRLSARAYSVTALEKYAGCPYRFYLNAILRLRPRDAIEPLTHLDALTRGHILHDAQFHIIGRLEDAGLLPVTETNLIEVLQLFEIVFDEVTERFHEELAPAIERIWHDELERIRVDLRGWLRREAASTDGFVPFRREYTFGMRPRGPADPGSTLDVAKLEGGLRLRGAIDLVEKRADGKIRVTDHKSGKVWMPESAILNGGESLQPVLYTLAYEALTNESVESARLYYCTERGGYAERVVRVDDQALEVVAEFQRRFDDIIDSGFFPASPDAKFGCRFCDYLPVCGPRMEVDAKRKQADSRLSPLNWLRNLT